MLPLSLAMIDIDRFKDINDDHGHPMGDQVLAVVPTDGAADLRRALLGAPK